MTDEDPIMRRLRDLLFEIEGTKEAKFLLCVCDDRIERRKVRRALFEALGRTGKKVRSVSARDAVGQLLGFLLVIRRRLLSDVDCINLWGIPSMRPSSSEQIFSELNFHRDTIASLEVPLLVWLTSSQTRALASKAPDFWSRRTGVYSFNKPTTKELLGKLFSRHKAADHTEPTDIETAFSEILASENKLSRYFRKGHQFSVEAADEQLSLLESNLDYLIQQCKKERQIEVALWLWNTTRVDGYLRYFMKSLEPHDRDVYGYVYTDRSEVILYLAEAMPQLLMEYAKTVRDRVRQRRRANLLSFFKSVTFAKMNEVLAEIEERERRSVHTRPAWADEIHDEYEVVEREGETNQAVYDLESWLSGYGAKQPDYFSGDEARMLKILYSESSDPAQVATAMKLSVREVKKRMAKLEGRVRLYFASEWLTFPRARQADGRQAPPLRSRPGTEKSTAPA